MTSERAARLFSSPGVNGWTGGQYSLFRLILGTYLAVHFVHLLPWAAEVFSSTGMVPRAGESPLLHLFPNLLALADGPAVVRTLVGMGAALSVLIAIGWHDRVAVVGVWYILACLFGRNPLTSNPSLPFVGWILLAHAAMPAAPYGSMAARGRTDPSGGWHFPRTLFAAAWVVMAVGYTYSGCMKLSSPSWVDGSALRRVLENPLARPSIVRDAVLAMPGWTLRVATWGALGLELLFAPLAMLRRTRPWVWLAMLGMHLGLIAVVSFADLSLGMVVLHLFTFNPAWIAPRPRVPATMVFFDGECGLCHRFVRFATSEDRAGNFRFAPLKGVTAARLGLPGAATPDSMVVITPDGRRLYRSEAVRASLAALGGVWRLASGVMRLVPRAIADGCYDAVARRRREVFEASMCPVPPASLRGRLLP
jgi:predicted DCC family thiol-disulfide oxidoreductase YuxK